MKKTTAISGVAIAAMALTFGLVGCGGDEKPAAKTTSSSTSTSTSTSAKPSSNKVPPRTTAQAPGPNPTIATYIQENQIVETPVKRGDPGSPTIDLPVPPGWEIVAAEQLPQGIYGAITYTGPEATAYTPSVEAIVSKLTGNVDPQKIIDLAPGELQNLAGYKPLGDGGKTSTLSGFPAYQLGGTWTNNGQTEVIMQKTVTIPGSDGLYVLQLNAHGAENHVDIVSAATNVIDEQTTITP